MTNGYDEAIDEGGGVRATRGAAGFALAPPCHLAPPVRSPQFAFGSGMSS